MFCRHVFGNISGGFRGISRFLGISRDFAEIPEFRGSATARNIRSPVLVGFILPLLRLLLFNDDKKPCQPGESPI